MTNKNHYQKLHYSKLGTMSTPIVSFQKSAHEQLSWKIICKYATKMKTRAMAKIFIYFFTRNYNCYTKKTEMSHHATMQITYSVRSRRVYFYVHQPSTDNDIFDNIYWIPSCFWGINSKQYYAKRSLELTTTTMQL